MLEGGQDLGGADVEADDGGHRDGDPSAVGARAEKPDHTEAAREGLREVQAILLGRQEDEWRNALSQLAATHPLSVFRVCVVRSYELGGFVIPVGDGWASLFAS